MPGVASKATYVEPITDPIRVEEHFDANGNLLTIAGASSGVNKNNYIADNADAQAVSATALDLLTVARLEGFNGTTWDRLRTTTVGAVGTQRTALEFTFTNVPAGIATTVIKASPGILHSIVFNSAALATNVTTVYDNASGAGTVIAIPAATTATVPTTLIFDCKFVNGLTIITTTANGSNMTVNWM